MNYGAVVSKLPEREEVSLALGAVMVAERPTIVRTVLGSCVAVILHVPRLAISALCHAQMPEKRDERGCRAGCSKPCLAISSFPRELFYVTCSIRFMLTQLRQRSVANHEIVATLVGGANVVPAISTRWSVAKRNLAVARTILDIENIPITYSDTGGVHGRAIRHFSDLNRTEVHYHGLAGDGI